MSTYLHRDLFQTLEGVLPHPRRAGDYELYIRLLRQERLQRIGRTLAGARRHDDALSMDRNAGHLAELEERAPVGGFTDEGVSIHVCATDGGHEYLRFDVFDDDPHYHYVDTSGQSNRVVAFDDVAHGDMLPWALDRLRTKLPSMLRAAGGQDVAADVEALPPAELESAVDAVAALAAEARRSQRAS
jgi:hypothetical protein